MSELTEADKANIRVVWEKLAADPEGNGRTVVLRLFTDYPETKKYFQHFKDISTQEEMQKSAQIKRHGKTVMNKLTSIFEKLDDWAAVCTILDTMAERHVHKHKVEVYNFQIIFNLIVTIMGESLGSSFTPEIRESWVKTFNIIYHHLEDSYKKYEATS
ncbi:cytoglobin-2-like [Chiloscyllium plagiosum]|uniref:cytoglobin-2-like n=1 Tax=Chiloscyllium plagiosum TaxID=36176 RepID=UPI001CB87795|nr:cytoglobin-2-like [Chiloscyllium plagiosum]